MDIEARAESLAQKIKHLVLTTSGHTMANATIDEFYRACCLAFREEIMVNQVATIDTIRNKKPRMINFISMEYLPGRLLNNNISNLSALELVKTVSKKMGKNLSEVMAREPDPGLGNGGLGRLASCFLDSLATLNYPARGYGLRYQYGVFEQEIWNGLQVERPDRWLLYEDPWEARRDLFSVNIHFGGELIAANNKRGEDIYLLDKFDEVRAIPFDTPIIGYREKATYSVLLLRLWSTKESPRNFALQRFNAGLLGQAAENTALTDVLYPNENHELGKRFRLKQEFLLVSASLQDIVRRHLQVYGDMKSFADKVRLQLNDTHPALMIAEMIRVLMKNHNFSWAEALETTQTCCSYTNHTILREALEEWNENRLQELLPRQYQIIQRLNLEFCNQVRKKFPGDEEKVRRLSILENGQARMAHLSIVGCHKINGVAKLHSKILKEHLFKDFADMDASKFTNVTNGVTQRRWLLGANPTLAEFITKRIGPDWICRFTEIAKLSAYASDPEAQKEFLEIKRNNKKRLLDFLAHQNCLRDPQGNTIGHSHVLDVEALFDVQIKRIHEYKRQLMNVLHLIMLSQEPNPRKVRRFSIFAGKAAPGYERAKQIITLICAVARTLHRDGRKDLSIAFVENYGVSRAEILIPAAELSEQISTAGWEASGTGNMKLAINGALTIGTEDGANIEMHEAITSRWWPFGFGKSAEENRMPYNPQEIYQNDEAIRRAVDTLKNNTFSESAAESKAFHAIYQNLIETDFFRVLQDLRAYYNTQKKVEELYLKPNAWAEVAIHNIAAMGRFSADESIRNYAKTIWGIEPCPPDAQILDKVRAEYAAHDRCRIS